MRHARPAADGDPEDARRVMETYIAADLSAERNEPVDLPLNNEALSAVAAAVAAAAGAAAETGARR